MKSVRVIVTGRVQGVWYRAWTEKEALVRGLDGWVRNLSDGTVEAVFSGPGQEVDDMIAACRTGPPLARVKDVTVTACDAPEAGFVKRETV